MKSFFLLLVLSGTLGMAQAQTTPLPSRTLTPTPGTMLLVDGNFQIVEPRCQDEVQFHGHVKAIKDIFPEECSITLEGDTVKPLTSQMPPSAGGTGTLPALVYPTLEPPDVPAIKEWNSDWLWVSPESASDQKACLSMPTNGAAPSMVPGPWKWRWRDGRCEYQFKRETCADRSRILLTAEDGKRWCHKPDMGEKP